MSIDRKNTPRDPEARSPRKEAQEKPRDPGVRTSSGVVYAAANKLGYRVESR